IDGLHHAVRCRRADQPLPLRREPARPGAGVVAADVSRNIRQAGFGRGTLATIVALVYFFPVLWIILTAFKSYSDTLAVPPVWFFTPTLENFFAVFSRSMTYDGAAVDTGFDLFFF